MATEHSFIRTVHRQLKKAAPELHHWKINTQYSNGVPDCWYSGDHDLWVEYKWIHELPKLGTTKIDLTNPKRYLSLLQQDWLVDRHEEGRRVAVVVGSPKGAVFFQGKCWQLSLTTKEFTERMSPNKSVATRIITICERGF